MENNQASQYFFFNQEILDSWVDSGIKLVKLVELESGTPVKYFELIPDPEFPSADDTIYPIDAEDITELVEPIEQVKFVVHEIYLEMDEEEED